MIHQPLAVPELTNRRTTKSRVQPLPPDPQLHHRNTPPTMHFPVSTVLTLLLVGLVSATPKERTATLYQWPLTAQTPTPLAEISYNPITLTASYRPVSAELIASEEPTRIGVLTGKSERWVGTAVTLSVCSRSLGCWGVMGRGSVRRGYVKLTRFFCW